MRFILLLHSHLSLHALNPLLLFLDDLPHPQHVLFHRLHLHLILIQLGDFHLSFQKLGLFLPRLQLLLEILHCPPQVHDQA